MTQDTKIEAVGHTDGGPAFPFGETEHCVVYPGMTLRDWFAGQALVGLLASGTWSNGGDGFEAFITEKAFNVSDAMLTERSKAEGRAS